VVVHSKDNELPARQAGGDIMINPVTFAGLLLAGSAGNLHVADYLTDLSSKMGRDTLREREAIPDEVATAFADHHGLGGQDQAGDQSPRLLGT
jgi:voltage-gated potassium channel